MASVGIGMIHSVSGGGCSHDLDGDMERYFGAGLKNGMQYRVFFQTMDTEKVIKRGLTTVSYTHLSYHPEVGTVKQRRIYRLCPSIVGTVDSEYFSGVDEQILIKVAA